MFHILDYLLVILRTSNLYIRIINFSTGRHSFVLHRIVQTLQLSVMNLITLLNLQTQKCGFRLLQKFVSTCHSHGFDALCFV